MTNVQRPMKFQCTIPDRRAKAVRHSPGHWTLDIGHWIFASVLFACSASPSPAHDSPEHVIEILTARMEVTGLRPDLLWRRATEHRVLADLPAAAADLERALRIKRDYFPALIDLSRVQLAQGKRRRALATMDRAISFVPDEPGRAPLRMIRAEIHDDAGHYEKALAECDLALQHASGTELDWYLTRSQLQCRLGKFNEAVAGLTQGFELTGSAVLEVEAIDALIDAGRFAEAIKKIEPVLADTRWRSSWLIRRARVSLGQGDISQAHRDLAAAIIEINQRFNPDHPDATLLADRGFAQALLGDIEPARHDLKAARQSGADAATLRRLELALASTK